MSIRKQIRAKIKTILLNTTSAGANVYSGRTTPLWQAELPAILIYTREEPSERLDRGGEKLLRNCQVAIEARVRLPADSSLDDTLDDLAQEIEDKIEADETLGGLALHSTLLNTEIDVTAEGERELGAIRLTYAMAYTT